MLISISLFILSLLKLSLADGVHPYQDGSTYANINEVRTLHFDLNVYIDFDKQILNGTNTLTIQSLYANTNRLVLDY